MSKRRVMVVLSHRRELASMAMAAGGRLDTGQVPATPGVEFDAGFAPVQLPGKKPREGTESPHDLADGFALDKSPEGSTYVVRAEAEEAALERLSKQPGVVGVFAVPRPQAEA